MKLLNSEPTYDYVSNSNSWVFFNNTNRLYQYPQCDGTVRYALSLNFSKLEIIFTSKGEVLTKDELIALEGALVKKLWFSLHDEATKAHDLFDICNKLALQKEVV